MINSKRMPRHKQKHANPKVKRYSSSKVSGGGIQPLAVLLIIAGVVMAFSN